MDPKMKTLLTAIIFVFILFNAQNINAACETDLEGQSENYKVIIVQDCGIESEIRLFGLDTDKNEYSIENPVIPLKGQCEFIYGEETIITCREEGKTILRGTSYKMTLDGMPICTGDSIAPRYTCIKGCNKNAPQYFSITPYEC
jgi:hypothetical protein